MLINASAFVKSTPSLKDCPKSKLPEYAFIGRSNVGKSSLINYITGQKGLAKTSSTPGKTQLINFFLINNLWHIVDLPGLGYAKVSKTKRNKWAINITNYLSKREVLMCTFYLVDVRHEPQKIDMEFMEWMAENQLPFVIVFTKADKISQNELIRNLANYKREMLKKWEDLPEMFITSSEKKKGREELLKFIADTNKIITEI